MALLTMTAFVLQKPLIDLLSKWIKLIRYRSRRAIVKVRVMKLRGGKARAAYSHL